MGLGIQRPHLCHELGIFRGNDLSTIRRVHLVPVVNRGVVARGHHHAPHRAQFSNRPRQLWSGPELRIEPRLKAIGRQDLGGDLGKLLAAVTAVTGHCHAVFLSVGRIAVHLFQVVGEALGGIGNGGGVDAVGARAHLPSKPARAERQIHVKRIDECFSTLGVVIASVEPLLDRQPGVFVMGKLCPSLRLGTNFVQESFVSHSRGKVHTSFFNSQHLWSASVQWMPGHPISFRRGLPSNTLQAGRCAAVGKASEDTASTGTSS